ncbi:hypothetical protein A3G67_02290 [Candidatus Roizmanbacteria bacterium RIFCSPLOWO2_12_FULL_40_12]|uniref:DNA recombination protein RmuC n=1 Tax=Candidatus Roizmanbacteria bacterium RIFCSPLOWO2_01_FULL_40_42 TaxID=1802066 RepID=A0A1F7J4X7_9BACT|nr:MAG: hypothetical protein A2779_01550 [Candidatus Roizmanbacteria bacterium RIFCSPHIGHO2_01_FULL_40_98]OGK29044.1 MAG: hypothetical protein A3C31_02190 [Candidatus Roizmanbacteria bacterium RIFCSPHIGHO2_02_FULL_40_53]OGK29970.1 MAG: hypothetical protein A2W49_00075 [Candidatus Roizmanbacteria bacterium RIFCSPHIGHO2_12_41_18]OGK36299.1 MAG: hypothetical protein A3E69_03635 [Candidatus Roizmanbacteria bacterium RIFCSPHIGHO2_12_FULL_40_130]OGK50671.1 MAG: hypothetical protein A3B50_00645 [Candi
MNVSIILALIFLISILSIGVILFFVHRWLAQLKETDDSSDKLLEVIKTLQTGGAEDRKVLQQSLERNQEAFNTRLDNAAKVIGGVQKSIGEFSEIGRSMRDLQDFLQSPKLRGNIGESILKDLLTQHFPKESYRMQYAFKNGEKVDAVIKTAAGIIPIDSKFPMENYRKMVKETSEMQREKIKKEFVRDVKKHIQDISKKYILVTEGTTDYAFMYIPSEAIFYEIVSDADLYDFSSRQRVISVSPTSFYAYIRAILMSMEGQRIQSKAKEILEILQSIKKDYEKSDEALAVLTKHVTNAYNQIAQFGKNFSALGQKIASTRLLTSKKDDEKLLKEAPDGEE